MLENQNTNKNKAIFLKMLFILQNLIIVGILGLILVAILKDNLYIIVKFNSLPYNLAVVGSIFSIVNIIFNGSKTIKWLSIISLILLMIFYFSSELLLVMIFKTLVGN